MTSRDLGKRSIFSSIGHTVEGWASSVAGGVKGLVEGELAGVAGLAGVSRQLTIASGSSEANNVSGGTSDHIPYAVNAKYSVLDARVECEYGSAKFDAGLDVDINMVFGAQLDYSWALAGTIAPPEISDFAIGAGLEVNVDGTLDVDLSASVRNSPICLPSHLVYQR